MEFSKALIEICRYRLIHHRRSQPEFPRGHNQNLLKMSTKDKPNDNLISGSISSSDVKNKLRRIELVRKQKQMKSSLKKKEKLRRRKMEEKDPKLKEVRIVIFALKVG